MKRAPYTAIAALCAGAVLAPCAAARARAEEPRIIERVIRIEGSQERPRVIFIVPRSKLRKEGLENKSYLTDILAPVYPEGLVNANNPTNFTRR
ncbi:MAG: hypothetical protein HZB22_03870 [Deltaproteobacteria bacterium]|nr:hypothetical protein [Deltaproteobacteria bacterium]